jgi:hypothetical protein
VAEAKSLQEGAQQAQQAAQQGSQQGPGNAAPSSGNAAQSASQAAQSLAQAASASQAARGVPQNGGKPQFSSNSRSTGKGQGNGQQQPGGEGSQAQTGAQPTGVPLAMPADLGKLGLTQADWVKLRGVISGVEGADGDRVPAEYRDLVRAYFGALSGGDPAQGEEGKRK